MPAEDKTYTAKWIKVDIVSEDEAKGMVSELTETYILGQSVEVDVTTNSGYTFIGLYCGEEKVSGDAENIATFTMPAEDKTYTAKWIKVNIVSEDITKGTVSKLTGTYKAGDEISITATTNPGYTFIGWYEGETKLTGELTYSFTMPAVNKTYTAKWIACPVTLGVNDENAGSVSGVERTILNAQTTITATTNPGYTFIGWYEGETKLTGELSYTFTMSAENKVYTAKWEPTQYSINLIVSGDTVWKTETAGIGSALSMPDAEEGMSFYGWLGDDNEFYSGSDGIINKDIAQDRTLYARFYQSDATPVATGEELQGISLSGKSSLVRNIDLGGAEWTPIGTDSKPFTGTIYGNGYTVSNFKITTGRKYVGLFGYNRGVIQNLGVENFTVNVSYGDDVHAGGLVGYNDSDGSITNCYATGNVSATGSSSASAGGLAGENFGNITNCYATGEVSATSSSASVGGLAGGSGYPGSITNCYATGNVSATSSSSSAYAGGLAGIIFGGSITNCYATGEVSATSSSSSSSAYAGGLAGRNINNGSIKNCYATGEVSATSTSSSSSEDAYAGGLVGYNSDSITNCYATGNVSATSSYKDAYAGGLVGYNSGSIKNCYATGEVSATSTSSSSSACAGGLAGRNSNSGSITNCYRYSGQTFYRKEGSNIYSSASNTNGTAEDLATLQSVAFHTSTLGWDASVWNFAEGTFPTLT